MKRIVADSTALILLAKCTLLETLASIFEVIVPPSVFDETASEDLVKSYPDAALIAELISNRSIGIENPALEKLGINPSLHRGERDALLLALNSTGSVFASDDGKAIKAAKFLKIPFIISPKIVVALFRLGKISSQKARQSIEKLGKEGRYSPEIIAEALFSLMEIKHGKTDNHTDSE